MTPYFQADGVTLYHGDCLEVMAEMAADSVDAIVTDPPYSGVLDDAWDNAWKSRQEFTDWLGIHADEWRRVLRFNGSLWCFAYPRMAAYVEVEIGKRFNVLNHIVWNKTGGGVASRANKEALRAFIPLTERIIFAEHYGADNAAKGESGWGAKCDELRGFVFEPLRAYLASEWRRAGLRYEQANEACGTASMAGRHFFSESQWCLPTTEHYAALQRYANSNGGDYLRREYEDLRREYEDLRRPFSVSADVQYSDVWNFNTSFNEGTLHPAQKPIALMLHIVNSSTRPGALVCDPFTGSGTTAIACIRTGRQFVGIEQEERYCEIAARRIERELLQPRLFTPGGESATQRPQQAALFEDAE